MVGLQERWLAKSVQQWILGFLELRGLFVRSCPVSVSLAELTEKNAKTSRKVRAFIRLSPRMLSDVVFEILRINEFEHDVAEKISVEHTTVTNRSGAKQSHPRCLLSNST